MKHGAQAEVFRTIPVFENAACERLRAPLGPPPPTTTMGALSPTSPAAPTRKPSSR